MPNQTCSHRGTVERHARARGIRDGEGILREGVQDSTGVVEEFEGLSASVGDCRDNLQILQSIGIGIGGRGLDGQAGSSGDGGHSEDEDCIGGEGTEGGTDGRGEHRGGGAGG